MKRRVGLSVAAAACAVGMVGFAAPAAAASDKPGPLDTVTDTVGGLVAGAESPSPSPSDSESTGSPTPTESTSAPTSPSPSESGGSPGIEQPPQSQPPTTGPTESSPTESSTYAPTPTPVYTQAPVTG